MFHLCLRLTMLLLCLTYTIVGVVLAARGETPPTALVFSQFQRGVGRYYVYLDPLRGTRARLFRAIHDPLPFQDRPLSPDGRTYIATRPTVDGVDLFVVSRQSGAAQQLTRFDAFPPIEHNFNTMRSNTYPVWSPDGKWIAFISSDLRATMDIYLISPNGADLRRVARDVGTPTPLQIRWSSFQERSLDELMLLGVVTILLLVLTLSKPYQNA